MGDKCLYCKTTVQYPLNRGAIIYHVRSKTALIKVLSVQGGEYRYVDLPLPRVPSIDGKSVRMYFRCPYCMRLKTERIVEKELGYTWWWRDHPGMCIQDLWHIPKPHYMRGEKYERLMQEFRRLQKAYEREFWRGLSRIAFAPDIAEMEGGVQAAGKDAVKQGKKTE